MGMITSGGGPDTRQIAKYLQSRAASPGSDPRAVSRRRKPPGCGPPLRPSARQRHRRERTPLPFQGYRGSGSPGRCAPRPRSTAARWGRTRPRPGLSGRGDDGAEPSAEGLPNRRCDALDRAGSEPSGCPGRSRRSLSPAADAGPRVLGKLQLPRGGFASLRSTRGAG